MIFLVEPVSTGFLASKAAPYVIGAVGSLFSSIFGNRGRRRSESAARKFNLEQWHRQNQYNHPIEQMARLKAAGLNPNLIYGTSPGAATGNAGAVAPGKAPDYRIDDPVSAAYQAAGTSSQIRLQTSSSNLNNANAIKSISGAKLNDQNRRLLEKTFADDILKSKADRQKAEFDAYSSKVDAYIKDKSAAYKIQQESTKAANLIKDGQIKDAQITVLNLEAKWAKNGYTNKTPLLATTFGNLGEKYSLQTSEGRWNTAKTMIGIGLTITPGGKLIKFAGAKALQKVSPYLRKYAPGLYKSITSMTKAFSKKQQRKIKSITYENQ